LEDQLRALVVLVVVVDMRLRLPFSLLLRITCIHYMLHANLPYDPGLFDEVIFFFEA